MSEYLFIAGGSFIMALITIAFGALHYRIDPKTDGFYTAVLLVCVGVFITSMIAHMFKG